MFYDTGLGLMIGNSSFVSLTLTSIYRISIPPPLIHTYALPLRFSIMVENRGKNQPQSRTGR